MVVTYDRLVLQQEVHIMPGADPGFLSSGYVDGKLSWRILRLNMNV